MTEIVLGLMATAHLQQAHPACTGSRDKSAL
jgi:hypothetical protein